MEKWKSIPYLFFIILSILLPTNTVQAQDRYDFGVRSDLSLPVLAPQLSTDGLRLYHGVAPLVIFADPNPAMQGLRAAGPSAADAVALPEAATATFSITFLESGQQDLWGQSCGAFPEEAQAAFQAAAAIWANTVRSYVPITVTACWANLNSAYVLGYSGGGSLWRDFSNAPRSNTWYAKPLANSLAGADFDSSSQDMYITYNSGFAWYYGSDGNTPAGLYDLVTVAAHEIAHGLNFAGSASYSGGTGSYGYGTGFPNVYDVFMKSGDGTPLTSYGNPSSALGTLFTSGDLWFDGANADAGNGGAQVKMYAPSTWADGSSYSHLDYSTFAGTPNSMMVYAIGSGSANHSTGTVAPGILKDLGWRLASDTYILRGLVKNCDASGPPVQGALISIAGKTATTGSTGEFTIPGIPAGMNTLTISKAGFDTRTYNVDMFADYGGDALFTLTANYSLSGKVQSLTGPPLEGASVEIGGQSALTDSTGAFSLTGIPGGGTSDLSVSKAGYYYQVDTHYPLYSNQSGLVFTLTPIQYPMSGTVLAGSATGPALEGATVAIAGQTAMTNGAGAFSIPGISVGTYTLTISRTGYLTKTITNYVVSGAQSGLVFFLVPSPTDFSMSGKVLAGSATGPALAGATVAIAGKTAVTDRSGTFKIAKIPAGSYTLTVSLKGYLTTTTTGYLIASDQSGLVFVLLPVRPNYYSISGTVVRGRASGPPLPGATVAIAGKTDPTDRRGTFEIDKIPAGSYTLTISRTGYITRTIKDYLINRNQDGLVFTLIPW